MFIVGQIMDLVVNGEPRKCRLTMNGVLEMDCFGCGELVAVTKNKYCRACHKRASKFRFN